MRTFRQNFFNFISTAEKNLGGFFGGFVYVVGWLGVGLFVGVVCVCFFVCCFGVCFVFKKE